ncbi:amidohydrolase family protein [Candidatus Poribacteria bacterium]|jgi:L-fuconolactonase|nr:amidohydrolase family protein [Candidatus Poribacteria bacterium]MBT5533223.1 amidohydrolase family protein [Candidatus Poribacteria bacterium]MBT7096517.1 amidohydrolase family protein [Candidatus Poribacteria bacterium]MBT7804260.1 amidohydrolase family protein [Candidatus Poribacteria bacterium]
MLIVDTHCHVSTAWYEPVEQLLQQMDRNGVEKALLVQMGGQYDNAYQAECVAKHPDRLVSVVLVDLSSEDAPGQLAALVEAGARGVRLPAGAAAPAVWRRAAELRLPVTSLGSPDAFSAPTFAENLDIMGDTPVVIEHLGGLKAASDRATRDAVFALAGRANAHMKIHGLGEFCRRAMPVTSPFPFEPEDVPLLHEAYDAFGPDRLMWGSDYPPVSGREGYANALRLTMDEFPSEADRRSIFGETAARVYGLA